MTAASQVGELARAKDVAEYMGVSRAMVYKLMNTGELPWVQIGDARRIPMRAVVDYLNRHLQPATHPPATNRMRTVQGERR